MQTEAIVPRRQLQAHEVQADLRQYEIYERYRQGESPAQIAQSLGLNREVVQRHLRELAQYARQASRDTASLEMLRAADRYNKVFRDVQELAEDSTIDIDNRLKAYTILIAAQQKLCDLYQLGRTPMVTAGAFLTAGEVTEEAILTECRRLKLPIPVALDTVSIPESGDPEDPT